MKTLILAIIPLIILFLSQFSWRSSLKAILFIVVFEGILRKWIFPGASVVIYFGKDLVLIGAYINYLWFSGSKKYPIKLNGITLLLLFLFSWGIFQVFNPYLGSPIVGVLGMKSYFLYIPIIWLLPSLFYSEQELHHFLRSYLLLTIPVGLLGIAQFFSPRNSWINKYADDTVTNVAGFAGHDIARISGTFPYQGSYAIYLLVCFGLLLCLFNYERSEKWKFIIAFELALVLINSFMNGSRTAVYASLFFVLSFLVIESFKNSQASITLIKKFMLPTILVVVMLKFGLGGSLELFNERTTTATDSDTFHERLLFVVTEPIKNFQYVKFDGYGIGATHQARGKLTKLFGLPRGRYIPVGYEQEAGRIMLDIGFIGFAFWYALRIFIIFRLFALYRNLDSPFLRQLALSTFLIHLVQIRGHLVYNPTFSVYYWFLTGFIFLLPSLEFQNKLTTYQANNHVDYIRQN